jgi:endogenous inhibitor of DNA gyrase (YacG/DUF329 family)
MTKHRSQADARGGAEGPTVKRINCPTCGQLVIYSQQNPLRPFCSESCKTGDLAAWATDEYRIPSKEPMADDQAREQDQDTSD